MLIRGLLLSLLLLGCEAHVGTNARAASNEDPTAIPADTARSYFAELGGLCAADNGKLWGQTLCGPFLFADPESREIVANTRDPKGILKPNGNVFIGTMPDSVTIANTAIDWSGTRWTMVMWDEGLGTDAARRRRMMLHEAFHRIQPALGLDAPVEANDHLEEKEGRYWLQLEWTALQAALTAGNDREEAVGDALTFRAARRIKYPLAASRENAFEIHEGLAEYTGARLSGASSADVVAMGTSRRAKLTTFARTFAAISGPLYGYLLDATGSDWRTQLKKDTDLGALLAQRASIKPHQVSEAEALSDKYGGARLRKP